MSETISTEPCRECGTPTEWVMRLDCPRKTDPPMPAPVCHRCLRYGRFRRRNKSIWCPRILAEAV